MNSPKSESKQHLALIHHQPRPTSRDRQSHPDAPGTVTVAVATAAVAIVPAAFWGCVVWLVWSGLAAVVTASVALVATMLVLGMLRAGRDVEVPEAARWSGQTADPEPLPTIVAYAA